MFPIHKIVFVKGDRLALNLLFFYLLLLFCED